MSVKCKYCVISRKRSELPRTLMSSGVLEPVPQGHRETTVIAVVRHVLGKLAFLIHSAYLNSPRFLFRKIHIFSYQKRWEV